MKNNNAETLSTMQKDIKGFGLAVLVSVPIFFTVHFYTDIVAHGHEVQLAFVVTGFAMSMFYLGSYLAQYWNNHAKLVPKKLFIFLSIVLIISITAVFLLAAISTHRNGRNNAVEFIAIPFTFLCVSIGMLVKLVRISIRKKLEQANASAEQSRTELKFLQNQLSPHFLFNTLNNIYGLSISQHEKVPALLLKLSDLLRYAVYDVKELFVPLQNELSYIKDYITFEKIGFGDRLDLSVSFAEGTDPRAGIAPLLLIVFVENAFKHSQNTTEEKIAVSINQELRDGVIIFSVRNSMGTDARGISNLKPGSGLGLENVRKRLDLLYRDQYKLEIIQKDGYHEIFLQLKAMPCGPTNA